MDPLQPLSQTGSVERFCGTRVPPVGAPFSGGSIALGLSRPADTVVGSDSMGAARFPVVGVPELLQQELSEQYAVGLCLTGASRRAKDSFCLSSEAAEDDRGVVAAEAE
jgi:hypothetical protein